MALYHDQVVTLKARAFRDHDALLTLFGRRTGKFSAIARGVRRPRNKMAGQLGALTLSTATIYHGRSSLDTITESDLQKGFPKIPESLERLGWAMVLADVVDQLLPEREPSEESFVVLLSALDALNQGKHSPSVGLRAGFRFMALAGFSGDWGACSSCGRALTLGPAAVDVESGFVYCRDCRNQVAGHWDEISLGSLRSLQYWLNDYPNKFEQVDVRGNMEVELKRLFFRHLLHETAKPLKSYDFLANIDRLSRGSEGGDG